MGSPAHYAYWGKEILGLIREKMATQESVPRSGKFFAFGSIVIGNSALAYSDPCALGEDCSTIARKCLLEQRTYI
jgi:hypothetical protein